MPNALYSQPFQEPGREDTNDSARVHHDADYLGWLLICGLSHSHIHVYDSQLVSPVYNVPIGAETAADESVGPLRSPLQLTMRPGYFSQFTRLLRVPMSLISMSQTSPSFMFSVAPSVPIQSTSPGTSVRYLLISLM